MKILAGVAVGALVAMAVTFRIGGHGWLYTVGVPIAYAVEAIVLGFMINWAVHRRNL